LVKNFPSYRKAAKVTYANAKKLQTPNAKLQTQKEGSFAFFGIWNLVPGIFALNWVTLGILLYESNLTEAWSISMMT
jgi:hypothetical protein